MKRNILITIILINSTTLTFGQLTKGNWLIGGSGSLSSSNIESITSNGTQKSTYFNYAVTPNIGYFFYDRFVGGLKIGLSHNRENYGDLINGGIIVGSGC